MSEIQYMQCLLGGILGILAHIFILKIPSLKQVSKAGNLRFSISEYFKDDWPSIIASLLAVLIMMFMMDEIIADSPCIAEKIKWFFITIGYTGSSIIQNWLGNSAKRINQVIDIKTNIADNIN